MPRIGFAFAIIFGSFASSNGWANFSLTPYIGDFNRARAGGAAAAEDATTSFTNPAGLARLGGQHLTVAGHYYTPGAEFSDQGSTDAAGAPLSGANGGNGGVNVGVPSLFYSREVSEQWALGIAITAPFGLSTEYSPNWVGRYHNIETGIETYAVNPGVGYKLNEQWFIGAGATLQRVNATLSSALDFGAICLSTIDPATCAALGMGAPQSADGLAVLKGEDWGTGFNIGILWDRDRLRAGLSYRSKIKHALNGDADFTVPAGASAFAPLFTDTGLHMPLTLPEILSASVFYQFTPRWAVMADLTGTRWSRIQQFEIQYDNPAQPTQILNKEWKDTWRTAIGADYKLDNRWSLQAGAAYEQSAMPDRTFDASIPVANATWLSVGGKCQLARSTSIGFGWTHILFHRRHIDHLGAMGDSLRGSVTPALDVVGMHIRWNP